MTGEKNKTMKAPLYSLEGKKKKDLDLDPAIYGGRVNERLLQLVQKAYAANLRRGTASTKVRKEVRGGGKKPWRQKGTGRARAGSSRSPLWKGGGVVFGPHPRSYGVAMPKGMRKRALVSALALRAKQKNLLVLEDGEMKTPKTQEWAGVVKSLPLNRKKTLCVVKEVSKNLKRASRNMSKWVELRRVSDFNAYHVLKREKLLIQQGALPLIEKALGGKA